MTDRDDVLTALREALKPFASAIDWYGTLAAGRDDNEIVPSGMPITLGDLRRARAVLARAEAPHVHEPDVEKERIGDEWVFCRCGKRIFLKDGQWRDANMGAAGEAGAPEPSEEDFKALAGAAILPPDEEHYRDPPWQRVRRKWRELRAGASGGQENELTTNLREWARQERIKVDGNPYLAELLQRAADVVSRAGEERPSGPWIVEAQQRFTADDSPWCVVQPTNRRDSFVACATEAEALAVRDALNRVAAGTEGTKP